MIWIPKRLIIVDDMIVANRFNLKLFSMKVLFPAFLLLTIVVNGQNDFTSIHFRGIRPDDRNGMIPLRNPGRGFRLEDPIDLVALSNLFRKKTDPTDYLKSEILKYGPDSISLVQTCLYLPAFENVPIPDSAMLRMQIYFDSLRSMGLKSVLRLAYKIDAGSGKSPVQADIVHHLDQLQQLLHRNKDVILVVQAGMLSWAAEGLHSNKKLDFDNSTRLTLLKKLLSVVPVPIQIQVRMPEYKNLIPVGDPDYERIGFYDDMFVIKSDKKDDGLHEGTLAFEQMVRESASTIVDGALPGGVWSLGKGGFLIDGYKVALRLRLLHFTSFSVIHNNNNNKEDGDEKKYSMDYWKNVPVGPEQLRADKMPFSEAYFTAASGNIVQRPVFDYICDHLGYRIELQQLMLPVKRSDNSPIHLKLELINRGFSAVKHPCTVAFVLIDPTGNVFELPTDANPESWQPFASGDISYKPVIHLIQYQGKLPLHLMPGRYKLGLWMADANAGIHYDYRYDIRCANGNMGWWISRNGHYGINILTNLTISK